MAEPIFAWPSRQTRFSCDASKSFGPVCRTKRGKWSTVTRTISRPRFPGTGWSSDLRTPCFNKAAVCSGSLLPRKASANSCSRCRVLPMRRKSCLRARITRLAAGDAVPGGIVVAAHTNDHSGFDYLYRSVTSSGRQTGLREASLGWGPQATFDWATNVWYWLRLRHEPNSLSGLPDLWAKAWRADGLTPEP